MTPSDIALTAPALGAGVGHLHVHLTLFGRGVAATRNRLLSRLGLFVAVVPRTRPRRSALPGVCRPLVLRERRSSGELGRALLMRTVVRVLRVQMAQPPAFRLERRLGQPALTAHRNLIHIRAIDLLRNR